MIKKNGIYFTHPETIQENIKPKNTKENLIEIYEKIIHSFQNNKPQEFIELYFGNNAINTIELCKILPIYV